MCSHRMREISLRCETCIKEKGAILMAIQVVTTEQSTLFTIRTKHTTYQMKADEYLSLIHI